MFVAPTVRRWPEPEAAHADATRRDASTIIATDRLPFTMAILPEGGTGDHTVAWASVRECLLSDSRREAARVMRVAGGDTVRRLRWHAGLVDNDGSSTPSVSSCTWPPGKRTDELERAVDDFIDALQALNLEVNGPTPSETVDVGQPDAISLDAAYAVAEVVRMLGEHGEADGEAREISTAWLGLLAGDIDDLRTHVAQEEAARPQNR